MILVSIPVYEAKNKLPLFIGLVENGETFEITRHGQPVAYLVSKDNKKDLSVEDKFQVVLNHWKEKYSDCFLTEAEEKDFELPRQKSGIRHAEDFE